MFVYPGIPGGGRTRKRERGVGIARYLLLRRASLEAQTETQQPGRTVYENREGGEESFRIFEE